MLDSQKLGGVIMAGIVYKCASYMRLSREDDRGSEESSSIESQRMIIESFAKFNGFEKPKEYIDDGFSGGNFNRPAFMEMIKDIENGKIDLVITKDLSRLGREMYGTGKYIEEYFLENQVRYIAINDSFDSNIGDSMLGLRLGINDLYLRDVSKKVKSAFRIKQEKGLYIGSIPCYGYIKDPDDHHKLIIDEKVADNVKYIYDLALQGMGLKSIAFTLTRKKIPIPIVYKKETRGLNVTENDGYGVWKHSTVKNILSSEMYIGNMVQKTHTKASYKSKKLTKVPKDEQIIVNDTHKGIIDEETFNKVQELLKKRSSFGGKNENKYLLSGLLFCAECGHTIGIQEANKERKTTHTTYCNYYQRKGEFSNCTKHRLNYKLLEEDILNYLKEIGRKVLEGYDTTKLLKEGVYSFKAEEESLRKEIENKQKKVDILIKKTTNLYDDRLEGIVSKEVFLNLSTSIEKEIDKYKKEKLSLEKKLTNYTNGSAEREFYECRKFLEEYISVSYINRAMIRKLIKKIEIHEDGQIDIFFNFEPLEIVA